MIKKTTQSMYMNHVRGDNYTSTLSFQDVYETFNVILRRKPKENNFKAVLETIRDLMNTNCVVPDWLHDLILGYGNPDAAHYSRWVSVCGSVQSCLCHSDAPHYSCGSHAFTHTYIHIVTTTLCEAPAQLLQNLESNFYFEGT